MREDVTEGTGAEQARRGGMFARWASAASAEKEPQPLESSACRSMKDPVIEEKLNCCSHTGFEATDRSTDACGVSEDLDNNDSEQKLCTAEEAMEQYGAKFGEVREGEHKGFNRKAFPWYVPVAKGEQAPREALEAALAPQGEKQGERKKPRNWDFDSGGEQVMLCAHCLLPLGENSFKGKGGESHGKSVHGECIAQVRVQEEKSMEEQRLQALAERKLKSREEYCIGWRAESVPKNSVTAARLGLSPAPQGLCCVVLDEVNRTVRLAATLEPAAGVNLEYLLIALKARRHACREPLFSLDPIDPKNLETTKSAKRYEPAWLEGTSVGDVMFQADYFLKELSMGEYTMPVAGMLSVFDLSDYEHDKSWSGREWFVVRKAEVRLAEDNTLIPFVKMGVEAREQVVTAKGLEDAPVTGANHPLKKFAEQFTRNFDLIAERKSAVFHLRELAKASVMAKFLVDSGAKLPLEWLEQADKIVAEAKPDKHPSIPQLWNMRGRSQIQVQSGKLVQSETGQYTSMMSVCGGVEFGLDRFELAQRHSARPVGAEGSTLMSGMQGMQLGPSGRPSWGPARFALSQRESQVGPPAQLLQRPGETPQGVDLNLDKFQLSAPERFAGTLPPCSASLDSAEARILLGKAFLESVDGDPSTVFKEDDRKLIASVFSRSFCDRFEEGSHFIPPDPSLMYVSKLRNLVNEERALLKRRKLHFLDKGFVVGNAGPEFPHSWTSRFQVEQEGLLPGVKKALKAGLVQLQVDPAFKNTLVRNILPSTAPEFEKATEDGTFFRIYRIGSLEVRTTQEVSSPESVGVVFSVRPLTWQVTSSKKGCLVACDEEKIVRVKKYVEANDRVSELTKSIQGRPSENVAQVYTPWSCHRLDQCHYYIVLETDASNTILTEKLADGSVITVVNPDSMEDRNSLARLVSSAECADAGVTMGELKALQLKSRKQTLNGASTSDRKLYAKNAFLLASGKARLVRKSRKGAGKGKGKPIRDGGDQKVRDKEEKPAVHMLASRKPCRSEVSYGPYDP